MKYHDSEHCVRCGNSSMLYHYYNLDHLLATIGVQRQDEVKGMVCPKCRDEIVEKAKVSFDNKLGIGGIQR